MVRTHTREFYKRLDRYIVALKQKYRTRICRQDKYSELESQYAFNKINHKKKTNFAAL